jgi:hypothetical protein
MPTSASADENGTSFWIPGFFGSLAAAPQQPGWSLITMYYHTTVSAGANVARAREISIGQFPGNLTANLNANLNAKADLGIVIPTYVFATPVFGGQAAVAMLVPFGRMSTSLDATINGTLSVPPVTVPFSRTDNLSDSVTGFADLIPQASLRWNFGVHNIMTYVTGDIPVGVYDPTSLSNLGLGHSAVDGGAGYTYFNPASGREFSVVAGLTRNLKNHSTDYTSGLDLHVDFAASQFVTKQVQVGLVGYVYNQITGDSGAGDRVGAFRSRVNGLGPQVGFIFPMGEVQGYLNLKGYKEFDSAARPDGWNVWATFVLSPAAAPPPAARSAMVRK